jgi:hypothetical protein
MNRPRPREYLSVIRMLATAAISLYAAISATSMAQPTNGCGSASGIGQYVIPDRLTSIGCDFKQSCDNHDVCYGACIPGTPKSSTPQCEYRKCEPNGELYGQKVCDGLRFKRLRTEAEERRAVCDANFMVDIVKLNPGNARCTLFSAIYPFAVRVLGTSSFVGVEQAQNAWTEAQKQAYANAINEFYSKWSDARIEMFTKALNRGDIKVDFGAPLVFDPITGLKNQRGSGAPIVFDPKAGLKSERK